MLSKIYYGFGGALIAGYLLTSLIGLRSSSGGTPQMRNIGVLRMERGKYVYVPPSTYPSSGNPYSSSSKSSSSSSSRSYPSSGGFSGGK